jgi:hypothetical protein
MIGFLILKGSKSFWELFWEEFGKDLDKFSDF